MRFLFLFLTPLLLIGCLNPLGNSSSATGGFLPGLQPNTLPAAPPSAATQLSMTVEPVNSVAGQSIATITVRLLDATSAPVLTDNYPIVVSLNSNPGSSTLSGTLMQMTVAGVATFSNLSLNKVGTGYDLNFAASGLTSVVSQAFNITAGTVAKLTITTEPTDTVAGQSVASVKVQLLDANDNFVVTNGVGITASISTNSGSSTLSGTATQNTSSGEAVFSDLSLNKVGANYKLTFASSGLTSAVSQDFDITPGTATKLFISSEPVTSQAGQSLGSVTAQLLDANDNAVLTTGTNVTVALNANPGSSTLSGTLTQSTVNGVATFANLSLNKVATAYSLVFTSTGLTSDISQNFNITTGNAAKLEITAEPQNAQAGQSIGTITVRLLDANDNASTTSGTGITASISTNPGSSTLSGTVTQNTVSGVSTFSNLYLNKVGSNYALTFSSSGLTADISQNFNITPGSPSATQSSLSVSPTSLSADDITQSTISLVLRDAYSNVIPGETIVFTSTGTGNTITQPAAVTTSLGAASGTIRSSQAQAKTISLSSPTGLTSLTTTVTFTALTPFTDSFTLNSSNTDYTLSTATLEYSSSNLGHKLLSRDNSSADFTAGLTVSNTEWNATNSAVQLNSAGLTAKTGSFESRIISSPVATNWTDFSWQSRVPAGKKYPASKGTESGYVTDNLNMSSNVLLMHFDETSYDGTAGQVTDSSGTGNNGTAYGAMTTTGTGTKLGRAASFTNGSTQNIKVTHSDSLDSTVTMSWEAWIYPTTLDGSPRGIISKRQSSAATNYGYAIFVHTANRIFLDINGPSFNQRFDTGYAIATNTWYHLAVTFDGSLSSNKLKFYVNGTLISQHQPIGSAVATTDANAVFAIGNLNGSAFSFVGLIDEVALYERILSPAEITSRYSRLVRRVKYQARACNMSNCSDGTYVGPDNTASTFFTEYLNTSISNTTTSSLPASFLNKQYFQYKAVYESDITTATAQVQNVTVSPNVYDSGYPNVLNNTGVTFKNLSGFTASEGGTGTIQYQISHNGTSWYYWSSGWNSATLGYTHTNTASDINANISSFPSAIGQGTFYFRAFYDAGASATAPATLSTVTISGGR